MLQTQTDIEQVASQWILRRDQLPEYRFAIELMSQADREQIFWQYWDELDSFATRNLNLHGAERFVVNLGFCFSKLVE